RTGAPARAAVATATAWRSRQSTVGSPSGTARTAPARCWRSARPPGGRSCTVSARSAGAESPAPVRDWAVLSDVTVDLPVRPALPALLTALDAAGAAVLVAPPGTGKTTLAPLAVADRVDGRVVIAQPRRVAARAAARRMAELLGERVGDRVGYAVRGDRRVGPATRIEVVTTGLLVRRLHHDP